MQQRLLGNTGPAVGAVGLGCMGMSWAYQESSRRDDESIEVIRQALNLGVTFVDTANIYGDGHNEELVGRALHGRRDQMVLASKVGLVVDDLAAKAMHRDGSPTHIRAAVERSLQRLGTDVIDLYYLHRVDPAVPLLDTWGVMADLVAVGKVRWLGLSEVTTGQAALAHAEHPVTAIQSELSLWTRDALGAPGVLDPSAAGSTAGVGPGDVVGWCAEHGAAFVPFAPLGRGFFSGKITDASFEASDFRATSPRFSSDALAANQAILDVVRAVARRRSASPAQVAIAWTLAAGSHVLPIPGTKRLDYLRENVAATELRLTPSDLANLDSVPAATGSRY